MPNLFSLYFEFLKIGLFAIGGGLATIPFLEDLSMRLGWFSLEELTNMIAISESTPGAMGVNMATYTGFTYANIIGGIVATLGLITPSIIIILIIYSILNKFKDSIYVKRLFSGIRPASTALITSALITVFSVAVLNIDLFEKTNNLWDIFNFKAIILLVVLLCLTRFTKVKKVHPIFMILISAIIGIIFKF